MVDVLGMMMYEADYEALQARIVAEWEAMDEWDREYYEDFEDFEYLSMHRELYSED